MKRRAETDLNVFHQWLIDNRYSNQQFAELMEQELGIAYFSPRTVEKWRYGAVPHAKSMVAIKKITKNAVTADSFMEKANAAAD